jgi:hypothetical protein
VIRAFTPNDVKALKETIKTFPKSDYYVMEEQFTQLGTGQAFITVLNEKGIPTETVVTHLIPPASIMGPLAEKEYTTLYQGSDVYKKYKENIDPQSAFEMLDERMKNFQEQEEKDEEKTSSGRRSNRKEKSTLEEIMGSSVARQMGREVVRGVFGMLFGKSTRSRSKSIF